jgi:hypothetical protein
LDHGRFFVYNRMGELEFDWTHEAFDVFIEVTNGNFVKGNEKMLIMEFELTDACTDDEKKPLIH